MSISLQFSTLTVFISLLYLSDDVHAFQPENFNATVDWTLNPTTRGTLDILYGCLFTIVACTWSILHPNISEASASSIKRSIQKAKWMVVNIFCPEFMFTRAFIIYYRDRRDMSKLRISVKEKKLNGSRISDFMGGWAIQEKHSCRKEVPYKADEERAASERNGIISCLGSNLPQNEADDPKLWTMTHTTYLNMGGLRVEVYDPSRPNHTKRQYNIAAQHVAQTSFFDPSYSPLKYFSISENEILDKSKGDGLTKSITVTQIFWLVISLIMR